MPNVVDDCRHDRAQAEKWFAHDKPEQSWYWGKKKLREVSILQRMMHSPLQKHYLADWKESRRHHETTQAQKVFDSLATQWRNETAHISSLTRAVSHPAYYKIIGMGRAAVPLMLRRLREQPEFWFWALTSITREDPIPPDAAGNVRKMTKAWLDWGKGKGIL